jgi:hypothetical protein
MLRHVRRDAMRAAGWLLRQARRALSTLSVNPVLAAVGTRLRALPELIRGIGPLPAGAVLFGIPVVQRAVTSFIRFVGSKAVSTTQALWRRLRRCWRR